MELEDYPEITVTVEMDGFYEDITKTLRPIGFDEDGCAQYLFELPCQPQDFKTAHVDILPAMSTLRFSFPVFQ